jgi:hypothetical protein
MEDLIRGELAGSALVAAVRRMDPGASIESILDKVRWVTLQRIFIEIRAIHFDTVIPVIEDLCDRSLTLEDIETVLEWLAEFDSGHQQDIRTMIDSRSIEIFYKFCQAELTGSGSSNRPICCWIRQCTSNKKRRNLQPRGASA